MLIFFKYRRHPCYEDLLAESERLKAIVLYWRYPDGSLVPQNKRGGLFRSLRSIKKKLAAHPENPNRGAAEISTEDFIKNSYFDPRVHDR